MFVLSIRRGVGFVESVGSIPTRAFFGIVLEGAEGDGCACFESWSEGGWKSEDYQAGLIEHGYGESGKDVC